MPLARHDDTNIHMYVYSYVSTHMPLARHDAEPAYNTSNVFVSTHMPLARHDLNAVDKTILSISFYSHASCEA